MRTCGQLRTCDRCGASVFLKCTGEGEADGGYTRWNKFEDAEGWSVEMAIGDLCPSCTAELEAMMGEFKQKKKRWQENHEKEGAAV